MINEIGVRVGEVIKALGMKKVRFAEQIGVDQSYMTKLSKGAGQPSDLLITSICREFNVNETWLRTGQGGMFKATPDSLSSRLAQEYGLDELGRQIMAAYLKLDKNDRLAVGRLIQNILDERTDAAAETEDTPPGIPVKAPQEMTDEELHAELDRQLSEEKKQAASE